MAQPPRLQSILLPADTPILYFITLCVKDRERVLHDPAVWQATVASFEALRRWFVCSAVLMPDHLHALVSPREDRDIPIGDFSGGFKRLLRQHLPHSWNWQRSGFDRLLRNHDDAYRQWLYMRDNPVRAGMVSSWEEWPYYFDYRGDADLRAR
jgi:putative transposase